ncbi:uncharacterized protein LOC144448872 isoform X11 [Glandiceps talaboti]
MPNQLDKVPMDSLLLHLVDMVSLQHKVTTRVEDRVIMDSHSSKVEDMVSHHREEVVDMVASHKVVVMDRALAKVMDSHPKIMVQVAMAKQGNKVKAIAVLGMVPAKVEMQGLGPIPQDFKQPFINSNLNNNYNNNNHHHYFHSNSLLTCQCKVVVVVVVVEVEDTKIVVVVVWEEVVVDLGSGYGGGSSGGSSGGMSSGSYRQDVAMEQQEDTIFVSGLDPSVGELQLAEHFGQIGIIKIDKRTQKPKIWIYKNKLTGQPKGECTITYDDTSAAKAAIDWFNGKPFGNSGPEIKVELAQRKAWVPPHGNRGGDRNRGFRGGRGGDRGRGGGRGGGGGGMGSGGAPREGDWTCNDNGCGNSNFSWRNNCNLCGAPKPGGMDGGRGPRGRGGDRGGDRGGRGGFRGRGGPPRGRGGDRGGRGGPPRDRMGGDRRDRRPKPY